MLRRWYVVVALAAFLAGFLLFAWNGGSSIQAQQGSLYNCPQPSKWAISVWSGDDSTNAEQAFATCGEGAVSAAYYLNPESQAWLRWFAERPELSNLETLDNRQGVIALGTAAASAEGGADGSVSTAQDAEQMQNCPLPNKWAISVWSGSDGAAANEALATCGPNAVEAAYCLDPQTQGWLRWFKERPDISNLTSLNDLQGIITLGGVGAAPSAVDLTGRVSLPVSGDLVVLAGIWRSPVRADGEFTVTASPDVTQVLIIIDGEQVLGMQTIANTSEPVVVNITPQTTAETLLFLTPFVALGTTETNAEVLELISELPEVAELATVIESKLAANKNFFASLLTIMDQDLLAAYERAVEALFQQEAFQELMFAGPQMTAASWVVDPAEASGLSIREDTSTPVDNDFIAKNRFVRYVDIYDGQNRVLTVGGPGWLTFWQDVEKEFELSLQGRSEIILEVYGPGVHGLLSLDSTDLQRLALPTLRSVIFYTALPALNAVFGVADAGRALIFDEAVYRLVTDGIFMDLLLNDIYDGNWFKATTRITIKLIDYLMEDFWRKGLDSIIVRYVFPNLTSSLLGSLFFPIRLVMVLSNVTTVSLSVASYAQASVVEEFTVTSTTAPEPEVCDGVDNDGDGEIDEGFPNYDGDSQADCVDPDDDNDAIPDGPDQCDPDGPMLTSLENFNGYQDDDGCEDEPPTPGPGSSGRIAFSSFRENNDDIYVMNADGSDVTRLTTNYWGDHGPAWSPDGSRIAFFSQRDGKFEVYRMNADGSNQTNLSNNSAVDWSPSWSPDGTKIVFSSDRNGKFDIYVMNADGLGQTNLSNNSAWHDDDPAWSPDGFHITFTSDRDGNFEIYVMNADGTGQTRLTNNPARDGEPAWSPDGSKIAFASYRDGNDEIYAMNADGSGVTRLTNSPGDYFSGLDCCPNWSPDGDQIAFFSGRDGNFEIYVMNADGSDQTNITNDPASDVSPTWSP